MAIYSPGEETMSVCGAHGSWEGGPLVYDLAAGSVMADVYAAIDGKLPASVRKPGSFSEKLAAAEAPVGDAAKAKDLVSQGRRLTGDKDYAAAIERFGAAIEVDGAYAPAYSGRGYARLLADQLEAARADFERRDSVKSERARRRSPARCR
jgi:hypothetical protein